MALWLVPVLGWYTAHDALGDLIDATLVRGVLQREGWYGPGLARLFSPRSFLSVMEGRIVGVFMLLPPLAYMTAAGILLVRLLRRGFESTTIFTGAPLLYGIAGLLNTFYQMLLLRLLETGVPFYLIVTWLVAEAVAGVSRRRPAAAPAMRAMGCGLLATMGLVFAGLIVFVVPAVLPSDDYTGLIRVRSFAWPEGPDMIRRTLLTRFHPIRQYGTMTLLERGSDPEDLALGEIQRRMTLRQSRPEDRAALEARTRERTDEPLPWRLLGRVLAAEGQLVAGA